MATTRSYFAPGWGYLNEVKGNAYFAPGWGYANETISTSVAATVVGLLEGQMQFNRRMAPEHSALYPPSTVTTNLPLTGIRMGSNTIRTWR